MARPKLYVNNEGISNWYSGDWRKNFTKDWEDTTALLRRAMYSNQVIGYETVHLRGNKTKKVLKWNKLESDSLYI